jgi:hypothetical protein
VTRSPLAAVRADRRRRLGASLLGVGIGLAVATVHWVGLVLGGALVALPAARVRTSVLAGLGFGLLAWLAFLATLADAGALGLYFETGQLLLVSAAAAVGGGLLGGLVRGAV